jgi:ubiquinone/menaquinone biosynthesis C-methylase UbiE
VSDDAFKQRDAASYDDSAARYGDHVEVLAAPLVERAAELGRIGAGNRVLDVGCGTGVLARRAADLVGTTGRVVAIDLSDGMLAEARRRSAATIQAGLLEVERMDAEALALEDSSFGAVVSLCAVTHFPRIDVALGEMRRVIRPGGRLVVSFGAGRPDRPLELARVVAARATRRLANGLRPELRAPQRLLALARAELPEPEEQILTTWAHAQPPLPRLIHEVRAAGFEDVRSSWAGHEVEYTSAESFFEAQTAIVTEVRKRLAAADARSAERVSAGYLAEARGILERRGHLLYPYGALFVSAAAPASS